MQLCNSLTSEGYICEGFVHAATFIVTFHVVVVAFYFHFFEVVRN